LGGKCVRTHLVVDPANGAVAEASAECNRAKTQTLTMQIAHFLERGVPGWAADPSLRTI